MPLDLEAIFEKYADEGQTFEKVLNKTSKRADLHAFMLLDRLVPDGSGDILASAEHDIIWLNIDCDRLAEIASEDDILELIRCGVFYDGDGLLWRVL